MKEESERAERALSRVITIFVNKIVGSTHSLLSERTRESLDDFEEYYNTIGTFLVSSGLLTRESCYQFDMVVDQVMWEARELYNFSAHFRYSPEEGEFVRI